MSMRLNSILKATALGSLLALVVTGRALAVDGVIEINQARAKAGGVTPGDTPLFPVTLSQPGSYRLTGNLDVTDTTAIPGGSAPKDVTAIEVTSDNVTIDLNGFMIKGPCTGGPPCSPLGSGTGIAADMRAGMSVVGGTVGGMGGGGVDLGNNARVENVRATSNGGDGIRCNLNSVVTGSTSASNNGLGIVANTGSSITGNSVASNGASGIASGPGTTVLGNGVWDNTSFGISFDVANAATGGYGNNALYNNNGGQDTPMHPQVRNGLQLGTNVCGTDTVCP